MSTVLIVDDHPIIRISVRILLEQDAYEIVGESDNGLDALVKFKEFKPDLVILDIGIPKMEGLDVIKRMQNICVSSRVMVLTSQPARLFANRCRLAGASGFVSKETGLSEFRSGVKAILAGYSYFPISSLDTLPSADGAVSDQELLKKLSNRELMVLHYIASGCGTNEIARQMFISPKTVSTYKSHLQTKLGVSNNMDMVDFARRTELLLL
ncbi:TPA: response regulator transcription factor [Pseudomonas putida]|nr:response regulator transcription factor [Pseudomonas putida]